MPAQIDLGNLLAALTPLLAGQTATDIAVGDAFRGVMQALVSFDHVVVFAYCGPERPIDLYSTFNPDDYDIFVSRYQVGPYLLDPFYHAARQGRRGLWRMRELAPDRFFSSEYFRTYYSQTQLAEEIGFFVPLENQPTVVLSLMRKKDRRAFSSAEIEQLQRTEIFVSDLVGRFWSGLSKRFDLAARDPKTGRRKIGKAAEDGVWHRHNLTRRETAIVELVLQGHSSEAIGRRLAISTGTVKVHRRNVYRKLNISSQTQLLSLYLRQNAPGGG